MNIEVFVVTDDNKVLSVFDSIDSAFEFVDNYCLKNSPEKVSITAKKLIKS